VDEHRFARARFFREDTGGWQRVEPWMSTVVNTDTGQVLGIVDGRNSTGTWCGSPDSQPAFTYSDIGI